MDKVTTAMIDNALLKRYQEPEWYLGFEVGNSCGTDCRRHADAIAICAYPSQGFVSLGFEVKVSRSDLKCELDNPAKCEEMYQYVNEWYLVVPKGLAKGMMIPEPWGIIEYENGKLRQKRNARYHETKLTVGFMLAFIRGRQRVDALHHQELEQDIKKQVEREYRYHLGNDSKELSELKHNISNIEKETEINIGDYFTSDNIRTIKIAKRISNLGTGQYGVIGDMNRGVTLITKAAREIEEAYGPLLTLIGDNGKEASI